MRRLCLFLISLVICSANAGKHDVYSGFTVHGVVLRDRSDLEAFHRLEGAFDLDVWQHGFPGHSDTLVMLTPEHRVKVLDQLDGEGITHYLHMEDVAKTLEAQDEEMEKWKQNRSRSGRMLPFEYYPYPFEVNDYLEKVAEDHPDIVQLVTAGTSTEGRNIKYLKLRFLYDKMLSSCTRPAW